MAIFTVTTLEDESYTGLETQGAPDGAGLSLREALGLANADPSSADQIAFDDALAGGTVLLTQGALTIAGNVSISGGESGRIRLDGQGADRVFVIDDGDAGGLSSVALNGLVIAGGAVVGDGGGILTAESLTLTDSLVVDNAASEGGGGIAAGSGAGGTAPLIIVQGSEITGNSADVGGGILARDGVSLSIIETAVTNNDALREGGGVWSFAGDLTLSGGAITGNAANRLRDYSSAEGGGVFAQASNVQITGTLIEGNSASGGFLQFAAGGGLQLTGGELLLDGATVRSNSVWDGVGGGISGTGSTLTIRASEITTNSSRGDFNGGAGGGVHQRGGKLVLDESSVEGNFAGSSYSAQGGGIYSYGATVVSGSRLIGNRAAPSESESGGGGMRSHGTLTVTDSEILNNTLAAGLFGTAEGGGIRHTGSLNVLRSVFAGNVAEGFAYGSGVGGGLGIEGDSDIAESAFRGNRADGTYGGQAAGIAAFSGAMRIDASEISGNQGGGLATAYRFSASTQPNSVALTSSTVSSNLGDGIGIAGATLTLLNSTVVANAGFGVLVRDALPPSDERVGEVSVGSSILARNVGGDASVRDGGRLISLGNNLVGDGTGGAFAAGVLGDIVGTIGAPVDPRLGILQDNGGATWTHLPFEDSPAIDAGAAAAGLDTDQRGLPRVAGGGVDIGAVEREPGGTASVVLYRVNAGGPSLAATDGGPDWSADTLREPSPFLTSIGPGWSFFRASNPDAYGPVSIADPDLAGDVPLMLFESERLDRRGGLTMNWEFPVAAGSYTVTLYFAEIWTGIDAIGERVFDVRVEGMVPDIFEDIDPFASGGAAGGFALSHTATVNDGALSLEFLNGVQNPVVSGIEIRGSAVFDDIAGDATSSEFLQVGGTRQGGVDFVDDEDWFPTALLGGIAYVFTLRPDTSDPSSPLEAPVLRLYDGSGLLLAEATDPAEARLVFTAAADTQVFASAGAGTLGRYEISVDYEDDIPGDTSTTEVIAVGGEGRGIAQFEGDEDWFAVDLKGGNQYLFEQGDALGAVDPLPLFANVLRLYDASGALMSNPSDRDRFIAYSPTSDERVFVAATGTYSPERSPVAFETGSYAIRVSQITPDLEPVYRVNVGGALIEAQDDGPDWSADTFASPSSYLTGISPGWSLFRATNPAAHGPLEFPAPGVPSGTPEALFQTERFDRAGGPEMAWEFPVLPGEYLVRLHFAELWTGVTAPGRRVFDVAVEGRIPPTFDDIDAFAVAGPAGGFVREHVATVTDGALSLAFLRGIGNPDVNAIEILRQEPGDVPGDPSSTASLILGGAPVDGSIDFPTDEDWFAVALKAGQTYAATLRSDSAAGDPLEQLVLNVHDAFGTLLRGGQRPGPELIDVFEADANMTVFLSVGGNGGDFELSFARTGAESSFFSTDSLL